VSGHGDDAGLTFRFRWVLLLPDVLLWGGDDPVLEALVT
jgi:hypothetical protein